MFNFLYKLVIILMVIWLVVFNINNAGGVNLLLLILAAIAVILGIKQIKNSI